jgi:hypothetical protein
MHSVLGAKIVVKARGKPKQELSSPKAHLGGRELVGGYMSPQAAAPSAAAAASPGEAVAAGTPAAAPSEGIAALSAALGALTNALRAADAHPPAAGTAVWVTFAKAAAGVVTGTLASIDDAARRCSQPQSLHGLHAQRVLSC